MPRTPWTRQITMPPRSFVAFCSAIIVFSFARSSMGYARTSAAIQRDKRMAEAERQRESFGMTASRDREPKS